MAGQQPEPVLIDPLVMEVAVFIKEAKALVNMTAYVAIAELIIERVKNEYLGS